MSLLCIRAMGFPPEFFTVLFAIPRMAGYLSHWRESLDDPDTKIMRPAQVSVCFSFSYRLSIDTNVGITTHDMRSMLTIFGTTTQIANIFTLNLKHYISWV